MHHPNLPFDTRQNGPFDEISLDLSSLLKDITSTKGTVEPWNNILGSVWNTALKWAGFQPRYHVMNHGTSKFPLQNYPYQKWGVNSEGQGGIHYYTSFPAFNGKSLLGAKIIFAFSSFHTSLFLKCWAILGRWKPKSLDEKKKPTYRLGGGNVAISFRALQKTNTHALLRLLTFQIEPQVWTNYRHLGRDPPLWISHRRVVLWNCPPFSHPA